MAKLTKIDSDFKKKVKIYRRYLYKVKDSCDRFDIELKNRYFDEEDISQRKSAYIDSIMNKVFPRIDTHYNQMWDMLQGKFDFDEANHRKNDLYQIHQQYYKRELLEFFIGGEFFKQTVYKPLGYAGDFKVLNFLYAAGAEYDSSFYKMIDNYTMNIPVSVSVRNRKPYILDQFNKVMATCKERSRIMSVASNAGFELRALAGEKLDHDLVLCLVDADKMALDYVKDRLDFIANPKLSAEYIHSNIFDFKKEKYDVPGQDLIYSLGLYDYLKDGLFVRTAKKLYEMLAPGGTLIIGNVSPVNPSRAYMALVAEWCVIHRTKEDLARLAARCGFDQYHVDSDESGVQLYLVVRK